MIKIASFWGALSGLLYVLLTWLTTEYREALAQYPISGFATTVLYIVIIGLCVFLAMRATRDKLYAESGINYAQTLYVGVVTSVVTGIIFGIFSYVYIVYINPNLVAELLIETKNIMLKFNKTPAEIAETIAHVKVSYESKNQFMSSLFGTTTIGIICSAILAAFVRSKDTFTA